MDIKKVSIKDVYCRLGKNGTDSVYDQLEHIFGPDNPFAKYKIAAGCHVWTHDEEGWQSVKEADDLTRSMVYDTVGQTRDALLQKADEKYVDTVMAVPDESFIYYREDGGKLNILLTGWGYSYPGKHVTMSEVISINVPNPVTLKFTCDGMPIGGREFAIQLPRQLKKLKAGPDGTYRFKNISPGTHYTLVDLKTNTSLSLDVQKGKDTYEYDLTEYTPLALSATVDGQPAAGEHISVSYAGKTYEAVTDGQGKASVQLPLHEGETVEATMRGQDQQTVMTATGASIDFSFTSPPAEDGDSEDGEEEKNEPHDIEVLVVDKDGNPFRCQSLTLRQDGADSLDVTIDEAGHGTFAEGLLRAAEPTTVTVNGAGTDCLPATLTLQDGVYSYIISVVEQQPVKVMLRDSKGQPIPQTSLTLRQEGAETLTLALDDNGDAYFRQGLLAAGQDIAATVDGTERQYGTIHFTLDEGELEYLLMENEPEKHKSAWLAAALAVIVGAAVLFGLWQLFAMTATETYFLLYGLSII